MKLKELEKRLKTEPDNLGLRVTVAGLMREAGRSVEAVELYRSVALAYRDQGRVQQAIAVCRSILEIAPEDAACQGLLTMLLTARTPTMPPSGVGATSASPSRPPATTPMPVSQSRQPATRPMPATAPPQSREPATKPMPATSPLQSREPATKPMPAQSVPSPSQLPTRPMPAQAGPSPARPPTRPPPTRPMPVQTTDDEIMPPVTSRAVSSVPSVPSIKTAPRAAIVPHPDDTGVDEPMRRSSLDETPLPRPVPHHVIDPTSRPYKLSERDLDSDVLPAVEGADTRPGGEDRPTPAGKTGLAEAARRISGMITDTRGVPIEMDMSAELDTRQRPRVESGQLRKLEQIRTGPNTRLSPIDLEDVTRDGSRDSEADLATTRQPALSSRDSEDALTPPPLTGTPPSFPSPRSEGVKTPPPPAKRISIPPRSASQPPVSDNDDELTQPRDRNLFDDDDK